MSAIQLEPALRCDGCDGEGGDCEERCFDGVVRCSWCGEHPAEVVTADGQTYARSCVAVAEAAA